MDQESHTSTAIEATAENLEPKEKKITKKSRAISF
jgi:hypothetical protein